MKFRIIFALFAVIALASCAAEKSNLTPTLAVENVDYYRVVGMKNGKPNGTSRIISIPRNPVK